jgi:hypothetical protein
LQRLQNVGRAGADVADVETDCGFELKGDRPRKSKWKRERRVPGGRGGVSKKAGGANGKIDGNVDWLVTCVGVGGFDVRGCARSWEGGNERGRI